MTKSIASETPNTSYEDLVATWTTDFGIISRVQQDIENVFGVLNTIVMCQIFPLFVVVGTS